MQNEDKSGKKLRADGEMMKKILLSKCGSAEEDEFAADELELMDETDSEFGEDEMGIGESEYFSTCEYTMIPTDDDAINSQGS